MAFPLGKIGIARSIAFDASPLQTILQPQLPASLAMVERLGAVLSTDGMNVLGEVKLKKQTLQYASVPDFKDGRVGLKTDQPSKADRKAGAVGSFSAGVKDGVFTASVTRASDGQAVAFRVYSPGSNPANTSLSVIASESTKRNGDKVVTLRTGNRFTDGFGESETDRHALRLTLSGGGKLKRVDVEEVGGRFKFTPGDL